MLTQIVEGDVAAELRHTGDDPLAQLAAVQRSGPLRGDQPEAPGEIGIGEPLAFAGRARAVHQERRPRAIRAASAAQSRAMIGVTGKPCSAYSIAGTSACDSVIVPKRCSNACQPASAPGTVTSSTLSVGMVRWPRASTASRLMRRPARPLEFKPYSLRSLADHTMANMSPPIPVIIGSVTFSTAAAVTAASMALPPRWSTATPAAVASDWLVAIMPCGAYTVERWAIVVGRGSCPKAAAPSQASALEASQSVRRIMRGICRGAPPGARSAGARRGATGTA